MFHRHMFRKAVILGTGMIGGSVALALKKHRLAAQVVGTSRQESTLRTAKEMKAIDEGMSDISKAIQGADLVVLAAPVKVILDNIEHISKHLRRGCVVTDVGSTKVSIVEAAEKHFPPHVLFVGSHPMAGSEKSGISQADADLFRGAVCLMTPTAKTSRAARDKVKQLWTVMGANVQTMDPLQHDEALAFVSHLPHLLSFALMRAIPDGFLSHGAGGLRDTTRLAGSSAQMWADICSSNYRNVIKALDEAVKSLSEVRKAVVDRDEEALVQFFNQARVKREQLEKKKPMTDLLVTIDGPAGAGKSTVAKGLARKLGVAFMDTGAMYRALTVKAMRQGVKLDDEAALVRLANVTVIDLHNEPGKPLKILLDGEDVSEAIRAVDVTNNTFYVARVPGVRHVMVEWQRQMGRQQPLVGEGRDLGTVVFPGAKHKFYLDADFSVRCQRRIDELKAKGQKVDEEALRKDLADRDQKDLTRKVGPLKKAEDAIAIDSTGMTAQQVIETIAGHIQKK